MILARLAEQADDPFEHGVGRVGADPRRHRLGAGAAKQHLLRLGRLGEQRPLLVSTRHNDDRFFLNPFVGIVHYVLSTRQDMLIAISDHIARFTVARGVRDPLPPADIPIVAYDFGMKYNILRRLRQQGFKVRVVPATTPAAEVMKHKPAGIFLSNGPGDPAALDYAVRAVKDLVQTGVPIFGICLGNQIVGKAFGAGTFKLRFGHRGGNHPVKDLHTGRVYITSQNHGYAVEPAGLEKSGLEVTHVNLNDGTCEGLRHRELPVFCVQYHPEASPGPHDANYLFGRFTDLMASTKTPKGD